MVKHRHKYKDSLAGMPDRILICYDGRDYYIGYFAELYFESPDGFTFGEDDDFDWYDLTELGE